MTAVLLDIVVSFHKLTIGMSLLISEHVHGRHAIWLRVVVVTTLIVEGVTPSLPLVGSSTFSNLRNEQRTETSTFFGGREVVL